MLCVVLLTVCVGGVCICGPSGPPKVLRLHRQLAAQGSAPVGLPRVPTANWQCMSPKASAMASEWTLTTRNHFAVDQAT